MSITLIFHLFVNFPPLQLHLFILLYYCILKWNRILSLREGFFAYITSLTPPLFIEVHVPSQESKQSSIDVVSFNDFDIRVVPTVWYFRVVPTVWYFRVVPTVWYFRVVPTVWYFRVVPTVWYFCFYFSFYYYIV